MNTKLIEITQKDYYNQKEYGNSTVFIIQLQFCKLKKCFKSLK